MLNLYISTDTCKPRSPRKDRNQNSLTIIKKSWLEKNLASVYLVSSNIRLGIPDLALCIMFIVTHYMRMSSRRVSINDVSIAHYLLCSQIMDWVNWTLNPRIYCTERKCPVDKLTVGKWLTLPTCKAFICYDIRFYKPHVPLFIYKHRT